MKLLLRSDVDGVGKRGDIVEVADGYARNFLVPKGFAIQASPGVTAQAEAMRRSRDQKDAQDRAAAEDAVAMFCGIGGLRLGFETLIAQIDGNERNLPVTRLALGVLRLQRQLMRQPRMTAALQRRSRSLMTMPRTSGACLMKFSSRSNSNSVEMRAERGGLQCHDVFASGEPCPTGPCSS